MYIILLVLISMAIFISARLKLRTKKKILQKNQKELPFEPVSSPVAAAFTELLGTAGGIYLTLTLLVSFLEINMVEKMMIWGTNVDTLAFLSLIIAILQPLILLLINYREGI